MKYLLSLLSFLTIHSNIQAQETPELINIQISPELVHGVLKANSQELSFDFRIESSYDEPLMLQEIRMKAFDQNDKLVLWKKVDGNGARPSIQLAGTNMLQPNAEIYLFNPFHELKIGVPLQKLSYEFIFRSRTTGSKKVFVDINPSYESPKTVLTSPLVGKNLWVYDGSDFSSHHRRIDPTEKVNRDILKLSSNAQRFALDLVVLNDAGNAYTDSPGEKENWIGYGKHVNAPASGKVIALENTRANDIPFNMDIMIKDPLIALGNYIMIDHENGEYSLLAHFKTGTISPKVGDKIQAGDFIGEMGRSGMGVGLVHLHYELRTSGHVLKGEGLPIHFSDITDILGSTEQGQTKHFLESGHIFSHTK